MRAGKANTWQPLPALLPHIQHRALRQMIAAIPGACQLQGRLSRSCHVQLRKPGRAGVITMPGTPSDYRGLRNTQAAIRRLLATEETP